MIISGNSYPANIYPEEVEAVLSTHPGITDTAVVGVPDDRYGELVVACAVGNGASGADLDTQFPGHAPTPGPRPRGGD